MMMKVEPNQLRDDVVQGLRDRAGRGADISELVAFLRSELALSDQTALFPVLEYFKHSFGLTLREALPLREFLVGGDRAEVDSLLVPAMKRSESTWRGKSLVAQ